MLATYSRPMPALHDFIEHLVLIGLFGTLILPSVDIGIGISFITPCAIALVLLLPYLIHQNLIVLNRFAIVYFFILLAVFYSINYSYIILDVPQTYRDYMEFFRYFQVLPYLLVASVLSYDTFKKKFIFYAEISIVFIGVLSFLEITNLGGIASYIGLLYSSEGHTLGMLFGANRIIATGSDPNVGAFILAFFLTYLISKSTKNKFRENMQILLLFFALLMTQSRTVFIGIILSVLLYLLFISKIKIMYKVFLILMSGLVIWQALLFFELEYILIGFQTAFEGTNNSLNVRFENMFLAYERFLNSMVLGWGPAKSIHSTIIDSEYILIVQRYGAIGVLLIMSYLFMALHYSYRLIQADTQQRDFFSRLLFLSSLTGMVLMITNNFFSGYQSGAVLTLAIIASITYNKKRAANAN